MKIHLISVMYSFLLFMTIVAAYLVAIDVFMPTNVVLAAVLGAASIAVVAAEVMGCDFGAKSDEAI